ncbi:hypothetical protein ACHAW5_005441 [Stephanodiscus triporus]|uniref:Uncharacterized protein n=1 Tax=Stephanodiscus triporus TaxID=2934178 RepID=A0ABD3NQG0_9STRA
MEHDGGVLCLCAVPGPRGGRGDAAHRFLSGGADGVVRFWEARDDGGGGGMTPRLVRTYHGHSGYVHSIAVLGTCDATFPTRRKSRDDALLKVLSAVVPSSAKRTGNSGRNGLDECGHSLGERKKKTMLLFVSASRDNTVRIWPIVDEDGGNDDGGMPTIDDAEGRSSSDGDDPIYRGIKLRGHRFGKDGIGGVLCVCALPSLPTVEEDADDFHCQGDRSVHSGISRDDVTSASGNDYEGTESAGQFCSGGSDGVVRVWDVRSALNLQKTPKSGMYATIQLQCLRPPGGTDRSSPAITSLASFVGRGGHCFFSEDAIGTVQRYSCMNEAGNVNGALWWGLTGHDHLISGMVMLSSPSLLGLLRPDWECRVRPDVCEGEEEEEECGTMLVSSCEDGGGGGIRRASPSGKLWSLGVLSEWDNCGELAVYDYECFCRRCKWVKVDALIAKGAKRNIWLRGWLSTSNPVNIVVEVVVNCQMIYYVLNSQIP